ncbi:TetR/AcrR family transcriptional regulator [Streptomyces sp. NPDC101175]|uniref:TetR/AcrR family transcriptional regulator n=1 Tax=Streptomyces sp. NPDC101175 TaxID=3366123 RepID=UPI003835460D
MTAPESAENIAPLHLASEPAPKKKPSRRDEIVTAAAQFFAERGYHDVGMRDVAEAVGIRGASLYNHFKSKEEILFEIALIVVRSSVDGYMTVLDEPGTPAERLAALSRGHVIHVASRRVEYRVVWTEVKALSAEHRRTVDDYMRYYQRRVRDVVMAGARKGEFKVVNPRRASVALMDMINGISGWFTPSMDCDELADDYIRFGIGGVLHYDGDMDDLCATATRMTDAMGFVAPRAS